MRIYGYKPIKFMIKSIVKSCILEDASNVAMAPGVTIRTPSSVLRAVAQKSNLGWLFELVSGVWPSGGYLEPSGLRFYSFDSTIFSANRYPATDSDRQALAAYRDEATWKSSDTIPEELLANPKLLASHLLLGHYDKDFERYLVSDLDVAFSYMDKVNLRKFSSLSTPLQRNSFSAYVPKGLLPAVIKSKSPKYLFMLAKRLKQRFSPEIEQYISSDQRYWESYSRLFNGI